MEDIEKAILEYNNLRNEVHDYVISSLKEKTYSYKTYKEKEKKAENSEKSLKKILLKNNANGKTILDLIYSLNDIRLRCIYLK